MKRYEFALVLDENIKRNVEVEGTTKNDALTQFTNNNRFVRDLKTDNLINKDKIILVDYKQEVKNESNG